MKIVLSVVSYLLLRILMLSGDSMDVNRGMVTEVRVLSRTGCKLLPRLYTGGMRSFLKTSV